MRSNRSSPADSPVVKTCIFCVQNVAAPEPEDAEALRRFLSPQAKILPRRKSGVCAPHQRRVARAIKRAREIGYLPYAGQRQRR